MLTFYTCILPFLTEFLTDTYKAMKPPAFKYVGFSEVVTIPCGKPLKFTDESYLYCYADKTIYIGLEALWLMYSELGDAAPVAGIAHELGHHIQKMVGVPFPTTNAATIKSENQADCIAGAWFGWAIDSGLIEDGDIDDVADLIIQIADAEGPSRDHGTLKERAAAFDKGLAGGLTACNSFYPQTPVITR